ncbi:putative PPR repeat [Lyophyllum shimeji]|uniref:PPR repeat n=1 Tax=Lyophyllum shimeji TaxID=47721 RepID=A0A9P3PH72_LYOSH|nr:putative PPR repeat [Lyophyllum shimeji]
MSFSSGLIRLAALRNLTRVAHHAPKTLSFRANSTVAHDVGVLSSTLVQRLQSRNPISAIHTYYPALVAELQKTATTSSSKPPPSLTYQQLVTLLDVLATSGRPADLQRIEEILQHMPTVFGFDVTIDIHTVIIRGLIKHGNDHTIHRWLLSMPSRAAPFTPTLEQFHIFLEACLELSPFKFIRHAIRTMRQTGCKPTNETFKYLIRSRWNVAAQEEKVPHVMVFSSILDDMKIQNMRYSSSIENLLYKNYVERGYEKWAEEIRAQYRTRFLDGQSLQQTRETDRNSELSRIAQSQGVQAAIALFFKELKPKGCTSSPEVLRAILRHSKTMDDIRTVQREFDTQLTVDHWSIVITNSARAGNIEDALSIYQESRSAGVVPDAALVHPLLKALCQSATQSPTEESLDSALAIYRDLAAVATPSSAPKETYDEHSVGPDAGIYQTLLRGLASSSNLEKYFPIAKELLDEMQSHNVSMSDSFTASSIIVLFMRRAETLSDALDVYYGLRSSLDEKGYAIVLNAFCKLSFGDDLHVPSLTNYFQIVKDMRRAGLEITVEVYTILLHQLAAIATKSRTPAVQAPAGLRDHLITTTRRAHDFMTLDAAVSPDEQVWNQLMDTYQRLGCFADAYRVWETMYLSGRFNHVSVSIILDACGYAGAWQAARKITTQLFRDRFSFNLHNWNTWIECLCRLGRLNDAVKVVCLEMGKNQNTVAPDVESARILIKFARRDKQEAVVLDRLERYLPELWTSLPADLREGAVE